MSKEREVLKLARDVLLPYKSTGLRWYTDVDEALDAIEEVLAQPEEQRSCDKQEPVAYRYMDIDEPDLGFWFDEKPSDLSYLKCEPLYTTPPQRTWVGLTQEDIEWCYEKQKQTFNRYKNSVHGQQITEFDDPDYHLILAVTAKLKQKNGFAEEKNT